MSTITQTFAEARLESVAHHIEQNINILRLDGMNAKQITHYAKELFITAVKENDMHNSNIYEGTIRLLTLAGVFYSAKLMVITYGATILGLIKAKLAG